MKLWFPPTKNLNRGMPPAWLVLIPLFWPILLVAGLVWLVAALGFVVIALVVNCGLAMVWVCRWLAMAIRSDRAAPTR